MSKVWNQFNVPVIDGLRDLCSFIQSREAVTYVRWSVRPDKDLEEGFVSRNHSNGSCEGGLSAKTIFKQDGESESDFMVYVANCVLIYCGNGRQKSERGWLLSGDRCRTGADNEPLLTTPEMLAILSLKCVKQCDAYRKANSEWFRRYLPAEEIAAAEQLLKKAGL